MNNTTFFDLPEIEEKTKYILSSLQARHYLLESLNHRVRILQGDPQQRLQDWIDDLKQQQIDDMDTYKSGLLFSSQGGQLVPEPSSMEEHESTLSDQNDWTEQFADGFVEFIESENSQLFQIWLGRKYTYPTFIGFDIRRLSDLFEFYAPDACWLSAYLRNDRQIFAGFQTRDPMCYQRLEFDKNRINHEFSLEFGRNLGWRPGSDISRVFALVGVHNNDNDETLFHDLRKTLEKLDEIFHPRLAEIL